MDTARRHRLTHLADHEDDEHAGQRGYIRATDFALPYVSRDLLRHVNCGYLSTCGVPPTLLALKQRAQSLWLGKYELNDAFDFLDDLTVPYTNDDLSHHKPLVALVNEARGRHEALGTTYHCSLAEHKPREKGEKQKLYANHHNLIMHANACLERLDHEFSSTGGLMSLLPAPTPTPPILTTTTTTSTTTTSTTTPQNEPNANSDLDNARNSLLGQWLHFTQSLVARMHHLEHAYGNALDALAGEAAVPHQHLSSLGPDARSTGREISFPQDRWVLVNAGDDVFSYVHQVLDKQEAVVQARERVFRRNGTVGDRVWVSSDNPGEGEYARGVVAVNIGPNSTLFVLPAWERHPGVAYTRQVELRPTVVALVQPRFPAPVSELEKRFMARINAAQKTEMENLRMQDEVNEVKGLDAVLKSENEMLAKTRDALMFAAGNGDGLQWAEKVQEQRERAGKAERAAKEARRERDEVLKKKESLQEELEELRLDLAKLKAGEAHLLRAGPGSTPIRVHAATRLRPAHRRAASGRTVLAFAALSMVAPTSAVLTLPYTPTTILLPPDAAAGSGMAYIFNPSGASPNAVDFLSINISSLHASSLQPTKITPDLPFLNYNAGNCTTFAPSILRNGTITVFAGGCFAGSASSLWTYAPDAHTSDAQWTRHEIIPSTAWDNAQSGPYHLGGMINFSPQLSPVLSKPTLYLYGGMCPFPNSSTDTWQTEATYSNRMLRLAPTTSSTSHILDYATPKGQQPPVAEAGFTLTELTPSLTNRTSDNGGVGRPLVTQQTSHVLLGGHTQSAFVNMSTAAVWSLPEETWSFVAIAAPPPPGSRTDLAAARRAAASVDSRSGHTAVLSEDGTRLVVYGGWVGDVRTAAQPQLAVVRVGVGLEDWEWEVPEQQELSERPGVYGHGAVVLPGNVMMVYGGFEISAEGGEVKRRQVAAGGNMFYNITSMTWSDEYVSPLRGGSGGDSGDGSTGGGSTGGGGGNDGGDSSGVTDDGASDNPDDSSRKKQIGLGIGLGVGLLVVAILGAFGFLWFRRRQRRRAARHKTIRDLAQGVNGSLPRGIGEDDEMLERDHGLGIFPWTAAAAREWYTGGHDPYTQGQRSLGYETLRGGSRAGPSLFNNRPRGAKGLHQPSTSTYDFMPLTPDEDEDGDLGKGYPLRPDKIEREDDPFVTPTLHTPTGGLFSPPSNHTSPRNSSPTLPPAAEHPSQGAGGGGGEGQEQDPDVQGWVSDVEARQKPGTTATATVTGTGQGATGRVSPVRRGPGSTKSARHSLVSAPTESSGSTDDGRTASNLSERSDFSFVRGSAAEDRVLLSRLRTTLATTSTANNERAGSSSGSSFSGNSYSTARSNLNFAALQAEGPSLLLGGSPSGSPTTSKFRASAAKDVHYEEEDEDDYVQVPGSPSKSKPRRSWFGSLKRVFSGGTTPESGSHASGESPTREGLLWSSDYDGGRLYGAGLRGRRQHQQQQGRKEWLGEGGGGGGEEEEEWDLDLERAAEQRTVQIMFTVPKEPLRVVNAEVEREESVLIVDPDDEEEENRQGGSSHRDDHNMSSAVRDGVSNQEDALLTPPRPETAAEDGGKAVKKLTTATLEPPGGLSPSSSLRASSITSATLHTAETVRLERPKTRVLEIVESIESRSWESSPAGSPVRGS
ncbi:hypothetical protein N657DRAFT_662292 [Parathielavia appendiculata]|uniref:Uncharacterized protein n=1 Tax=Parathielavia appendiculata TaxID=2587402 RepID=A0AAN6U3R6_9PEZI|nr:hypothetical protein N657DRAFT_662292 [Parathielavia appendiculata]